MSLTAAMLLGMASSAPPTMANVDINIDIGTLLGIGGRVNCTQGRRIVERKGFSSVRPRDCAGEIYVYTGRKRGYTYWVEVRRRDGRVIATERNRIRRDR
ncbi:hypothetical protein [Aestuariivirga sp.]|uniref:hypothetical protein n=1 Tax=Aestuariivirga sp. TaxID=2650926 RepID=UPI0035941454